MTGPDGFPAGPLSNGDMRREEPKPTDAMEAAIAEQRRRMEAGEKTDMFGDAVGAMARGESPSDMPDIQKALEEERLRQEAKEGGGQ